MKDLEVGMYVRTKNGRIAKIENIEYNTIIFDNWLFESYSDKIDSVLVDSLYLEEIIKASHNIINLIEVGDIVEWECEVPYYSYGINQVINRFGKIGVYPEEMDCCLEFRYLKIKSILTKEQFENCQYRIGD